jgi:uroporphyrinogen III methyltransferase/synthase
MVEFAFVARVVAGLRRVKLSSWTGDSRGSRKPESGNGLFGIEDAGNEVTGRRGRVYIVGAGPGDPGLLTLKGKRCLEEADLIVYDYLVNEDIVAHGRLDAERVRLGKPGSACRLSQDAINRLLVRRAAEGKVVVRLKGGDPFIFSRGGEEAEALAAAGVDFEIVPGVTSAIAVPSYAGIPLTHRHMASSVVFVTGHEDSTKESSGIDWKAVAGMGTVVILMGTSRLSQIVGRLVEEGRTPETPVAVIEWGTWPGQRTVTGTLQDIRERAQGIRRPAVIVVGEVVRLRNHLAWFKELAESARATEGKPRHSASVQVSGT